MKGLSVSAYCPFIVGGVKSISSVVSPLSQLKPEICERKSLLPGPVKLTTSSAIEKLVGSIAALKVRSTDPTGKVFVPLGD